MDAWMEKMLSCSCMITTGEEVTNTFHSQPQVQPDAQPEAQIQKQPEAQPEAQTQTEPEDKPENTDIYELHEGEDEDDEQEDEQENDIKTVLDRYTDEEEEYIQQKKKTMLMLSMAFLGVAISPALVGVFNTSDSNTYVKNQDPLENSSIYSFNYE